MYLAAGSGHLVDLACQLAGGSDHQGADGHAVAAAIATTVACRGAAGRPAAHQLQGGEDEGGRLAGAGLGAAQKIAPGEGQRDGLFLDGGGIYVAEVLYSLQETWFQA